MWRLKRHSPPPDVVAAKAARVRAERDLEHRTAEGHRVRQLLAEWERIRERNHFASAIEQSFRGRKA